LSRHFNAMVGQVNELMSTRTTLLAGISHDLRTPLARMRLAVEIMREQPQPQLLDRLDAEIEKTNRLIGEVLDLARGLAHEPPETIELRPLLERLAQDHATPATPVHVDAAVERLVAAPQALARALGNLLQNSQRHAAGRPVDLVVQAAAGGVRLGVLDRGPGIPPDRVGQMLQPFQRLETSRSRATGGSGLGLAIVNELARANGWTLELSARPGGGLAAWLQVPAPPAAAPAA
jgi:two-component system osmolarity sensor histidine kinase EnvZ